MASEIAPDALGDSLVGNVVLVNDGNDKQCFPMRQGVLTQGRVCLLLSKGCSCSKGELEEGGTGLFRDAL